MHANLPVLRSTDSLRRSLPLFALIVALLGAWLQPAPVAFNGGAAAVDGVDRPAVKPQPLQLQLPSQLKAAAKKRLAAHNDGSRQPQIAAVTIACEQTTGASRLDGSRRAYAYVPAPSAIVAQPRAPPLRRTLTAA